MAQGVIHQHQREHGFGYRCGAQADAGVVAAVGGDFHGLAVDVDRAARCGDAAGGLDGEVGADGLAGGDAAQDAAGVVAQKAFGRELVAVFTAALGYAGEARADFYAFDGVDAHQGVSDVGIEAVEYGLAQAHGHVAGFDGELGAHRIERFADAVHVVFQLVDLAGVGGEKRIAADVFQAFKCNGFFADLGDVGDDFGVELFAQPFFGNGTGGHACGGFAGGRAAAAAIITGAVFVPIGVVGVAGAELLGDVAVVFAALVGVAD